MNSLGGKKRQNYLKVKVSPGLPAQTHSIMNTFTPPGGMSEVKGDS